MKSSPNKNHLRKIIIFCTEHDFLTVKYQIQALDQGYRIVLQTPDTNVFTSLKALHDDLRVSNDRDFLAESISSLFGLMKKKEGWYRQQYLKLKTIEREDAPYLILDGDTFLRRATIEDIFESRCSLLVREKFEHYNNLISKLLPDLSLLNYSAVANCILVEPLVVKRYIPDVDEFFRNAMLVLAEHSDSVQIDFSEYQIINTLQNVTSKRTRNLYIFRRADLLNDKKIDNIRSSRSSRYDGYAIEKNHKNNVFRQVMANVIYLLGIRKW